ncbi:MAG TPA: ComEC/Rec2 family competence protein [Bacteroidales bacterium]|nr:ComEC/Rec2 family competence protein [Bacteroidales bacterium]
MTEFFRKAPFVRLLIPFIAGILVGFSLDVSPLITMAVMLITFFFAFGFIFLNKISRNFKYQWLAGVPIELFLLFAGLFLASHQMDSLTKQVFPANKKLYVKCLLNDFPEEKAKSYKCVVQMYSFVHGDSVVSCRNKMILYFQKGEEVKTLQAGDVIGAYLYPNIITNMSSAKGGFDYASYLLKKGIRYSAYVKNGDWQVVERDQLFILNKWAIECREGLLSLFRSVGFKGRELGVLSALTIGYKIDLDQETLQAYSASGAMHILAVSGMHVGLIYIVLSWLLTFLRRVRFGNVIKAVLLVSMVWYYAFLTGLSPSVLRASVMITFLGLGQLTNRRVNTYNSLAIAAFVLLLINPVDLLDVGFQLSFLAVLGIIALYPVINNWVGSSYAVNQIWSLVAVSMSAQLATFPLSLYYFHQFPNYFLISNLVIVPLATLVIYGSICLLVLSAVKLLLVPFGLVLYYMVWFLNEIALWIERLPLSVWHNIDLNVYQLLVWYALTLFVILYFMRKKALYFISTLSCVIVLLWLDIGNILFN